MNTVTDLSELSPRVVFDRTEIDRLRWFQMNRYFESGLLDQPPTGLVADASVELSTYFGVYNSEDEIQATARVVRATSGLPMLTHHPIYPSVHAFLDEAQGTVAEVSRLAVATNTPPYQALALLSREFLRFGLRNQHATLLIASVEKPLVRILNRLLGVPLQIIGPPIDQYGAYNGECVPILIDTVACLEHFRQQGSRRWDFFMEGLTLDLTAERPAMTNQAQTRQAQIGTPRFPRSPRPMRRSIESRASDC